MARSTALAPSMGIERLQTSLCNAARSALGGIENVLEVERDQLALWLPVMLGMGIAAWYLLASVTGWMAFMTSSAAFAFGGIAMGLRKRLGMVLALGGAMATLGCGGIWLRSALVAQPVLTRPAIMSFEAIITRVEVRGDDLGTRLTLNTIAAGSSPSAGRPDEALPPKVRVSVDPDPATPRFLTGERIALKARLMPPAQASVPGGYSFARVAWFQGLGATGKALGPIRRLSPQNENKITLRDRLSAHVSRQIAGSAGGIATAFVTGDQGGIAKADQQNLRDSGLAHLLSISGLHISAVVAAVMAMTLRLLALSPRLALRAPLLLIAAGAGALSGIGYTLLTGSEVPTIRSCIAALLVLVGIALGREALTLRMVATGALVVLLLWPESLVGPSFQLSFAAITAIVALHEVRWIKAMLSKREEGFAMRLLRNGVGLVLTGVAVEVALMPIALFHFHKSGIFGALSNIIAIPLTTFVIMPLEALALLFDLGGIGGPFWWLAGQALTFLLWIAATVAAAPGAVARLPELPMAAFGLMVCGGLWLLLWRSRGRFAGVPLLIAGIVIAVMTPHPDILITGDGRHMAVRGDTGQFAVLRPRAGDFVREMLAERAGSGEEMADLDSLSGASCSDDACTVRLQRAGRLWRLVATRSVHVLPWRQLVAICAEADIVVSDRRLPAACAPKWIKADRSLLMKTGGLSISLSSGGVSTAQRVADDHPWAIKAAEHRMGPWRQKYLQKPGNPKDHGLIFDHRRSPPPRE